MSSSVFEPHPLAPIASDISNSSQAEIEFCQTLKFIHQQGWAPGTGGNFSYVSSQDPLLLKMAPSGVDKGSVNPGDLIVVNDQQHVVEGQGKASAETALHLCIIQSVGAQVVFHSHSIFNTLLSEKYCGQQVLSIQGYEMLKGLSGIHTHQCQVNLPIFPNSQDMASLSQEIAATLTSHPNGAPGFLLAGHGLYTWGDSIFEAKRHLEIWEFLFELIYRKLLLG